MACLIAIGGGSLNLLETLSLDRLLVESTNKEVPKALMIPTHYETFYESVDVFNEVYGKTLGCETEILNVFNDDLSLAQIRDKLSWADLIYVGDHPSSAFILSGLSYDIGSLLKKAWLKGTVIGGAGSGASYWFRNTLGASIQRPLKKYLNKAAIKGFNFIDACFCANYDLENRSVEFAELIHYIGEVGLAVDSACAIEFLGDYYKIHQTGNGKAYKLLKEDGIVYKEILSNTTAYLPIESLLSKRSLFMHLTDGTIDLILDERVPENLKIGYVPSMKYNICLHGSEEIIGVIDIRLGNNENTFYGGNIGYEISASFRGFGYASRAVKLIEAVGRSYGYTELIITCNPDNIASRKTAERAGAIFIEQVDVPESHDMYLLGEREKCRYRLSLTK